MPERYKLRARSVHIVLGPNGESDAAHIGVADIYASGDFCAACAENFQTDAKNANE